MDKAATRRPGAHSQHPAVIIRFREQFELAEYTRDVGLGSAIFGLAIIAGAVGPFIIPVVSLWAVVASVAVVRGAPSAANVSLRQAATSS